MKYLTGFLIVSFLMTLALGCILALGKPEGEE